MNEIKNTFLWGRTQCGKEGHNIRAEISPIEKINLKEMRGLSRYNTITKRLIEEIIEWILYHTNAKPECVSSDIVKISNPESNQKEVFPKMWMEIYVRDLHNSMIKPSANGELYSVVDSVTNKVLITDTSLRLFIPLQVQKMTHRLC